LQLLVECAPEPTVVYLVRDETSAPVPFLYSSDVPAFSGLSESGSISSCISDDAEKVVLPQDLPALREHAEADLPGRNCSGSCTYQDLSQRRWAPYGRTPR
jgi:hypothetical protein